MSIIKRKAGSEDIVKSVLEFDAVPTEGSHNLVESGAVAAQKATIGPNGVFIGSRKIHPGSKLFVEGLPVDAVDYALVDKYNAFIYNRITAFADSGTVTLGLWNYDSKAYVSEQQLSTDSDNPTVIDVSAANASDTMEIHLKGTGVIDHITGSIT